MLPLMMYLGSDCAARERVFEADFIINKGQWCREGLLKRALGVPQQAIY